MYYICNETLESNTMWKDFFFFPASDKRAILILSTLLLVGVIILWLKPASQSSDIAPNVADSVQLVSIMKKKENLNVINSPQRLRKFNPNTADSATMVEAGVPRFVARNIVRYREAGGQFRIPEQLARIYGMTEDTYLKLLPYIDLSPIKSNSMRTLKEKSKENRDTVGHTPLKYPIIIKYSEGTTIDLNQADTTELKKIPGIGSWRAKQIVEYRRQLGGFYDLTQLTEIEGLPEGLEQWFVLNVPIQASLNINTESIERLRKHPYLNFYQARCIVEYRRKHGPLVNLKQLSLFEEFTADDLKRLEPYVTF